MLLLVIKIEKGNFDTKKPRFTRYYYTDVDQDFSWYYISTIVSPPDNCHLPVLITTPHHHIVQCRWARAHVQTYTRTEYLIHNIIIINRYDS